MTRNPKYIALGISWLSGLLLTAGPLAAQEPLYYFSETIAGRVVDAQSDKPIAGAVVTISWQLRPLKEETDGKDPSPRRLFVQQVKTDPDGKYAFPAWDKPRTRPHGWQLTPGLDPTISVYASGYRRLVLENKPPAKPSSEVPTPGPPGGKRQSVWQGKTLKLTKLPDTQEALANEIAAWKTVIETEYAAYERQVGAIPARESQTALLVLWKADCQKLSDAQRRTACTLPDLKASTPKAQPTAKEQETEAPIMLQPSLRSAPMGRPP